ncbi:hypothetical protein SCFA_380012 [anaerobic digester metagenome]|jgi:hypothetical protein|uniref:Uncharacterized protein n=1 Tax=anaerobic digester metagenome TaxID=1263854 RepID=A0A485M2S7_9ZZZZ
MIRMGGMASGLTGEVFIYGIYCLTKTPGLVVAKP